ncbi:V-type ATP synthase subunit D [Marimonas arenosa]|uniref:V-type ATP synthase subunit D n=1 Tax=Marimonas arenosa TaxID=1795305 RepID=A0AAE4B6C4_9RHOB|nr:V-type ATP synthase subunit D [Marimonas arenosa]MDQ2092195.1 V-type ATP synthase subunit D [Marimonas arenosa]
MADITPTRGAALVLAEEKTFLETGFGFLDEKRMLLAATLLKELEAWKALRDDYAAQQARAVAAMKAAMARHGLENLQLYPVVEAAHALPQLNRAPLLGLGLFRDSPDFNWPVFRVDEGVDLSDEAEAFRAEAAKLVPLAVRLGLRQSNVCRLLADYRRTERRARALENVLMPEARAQLAAITEYLDEFDQEEAVRIRNAAR